ncbi:MAG: molybdenum cofactor biosynthesis F family protein [Oscillospiraceae bacterium]|jgi:hypothetical protein|nr:molybdenum cofactor biosynthesis F family protein [Oscillospiraceae bacterium]
MRKTIALLLAAFLSLFSASALASEAQEIPDLFFFEYSNLSDEEVRERLDGAPLAPAVSDPSGALSGRRIDVVTDQGPKLSFDFAAEGSGVSFTIDGGEPLAIETEYAALELNQYVLFAFRVPDSSAAWIVELDQKKNLAIVFEAWFAYSESLFGINPARETQRAVYTGYVAGGEIPEERPEATNRLTGKSVLWEGENGRFLTTYATRMWSSYVPLDVPGPKAVFTSQTDYFELDDHHYLYSRGEMEFSGALVVETLDLYTMRLIGARLGFDTEDRLEFKLYRSSGRVMGQYASYGPFGSDEYPEPPAPEEGAPAFELPKGFRMAYRPFQTSEVLTLDDMNELARTTENWSGAFAFEGKEDKMLPYTDMLAGKSFSLVFDDGDVYEYEVTGQFALRFRIQGKTEWQEERYEAFESDDQLVFFTHALSGKFPMEVFINVVDFKNGLATCQHSSLTNEERPRDPEQEWKFGVIQAEGITPTDARQGFTDELIGRSFTWTYGVSVASQHIYSTPNSYSFSIIMDNKEPGLMWSSPCTYVKIRDDSYLFSWTESRGSGIQGTLLLNMKTMHDVGACFGVNENEIFEFNTFCAEARSAGQIDLSGLYN